MRAAGETADRGMAVQRDGKAQPPEPCRRHAAKRDHRRWRTSGEPGEAGGTERTRGRVRGGGKDRGDEQEVGAHGAGAGALAHRVDSGSEQAGAGQGQAPRPGREMHARHPQSGRGVRHHQAVAVAPGSALDRGEKGTAFGGREIIVAEDDSAAARKRRDRRQEPRAQARVGHEPERWEETRLPRHGRPV